MNNSHEDEDDLLVEDILIKATKKIKSKDKGNRSELQLVHLLNYRFADVLSNHPKWGTFSRSVGSGNRFGQKVSLSEDAKNVFSGDLTCPSGKDGYFRFVIESKGGYNGVDLITMFDGYCRELDDFLKQVLNDSERVDRKPLLVWKKDRKSRIAAILQKDSPKHDFPNYMIYKKWIIVSFDELLKLPDDFFFEFNNK